jgi:DNA-directed RNA polymerase specialized sigma subunit
MTGGIAELVKLKQNIGNAIRGLNSIECATILEMRYLAFMTWEDIAVQMNYSNEYIYHLHRKALGLVRVLI